MTTMNALILAAAVLGLAAADWSFNQAEGLIFVGRKVVAAIETVAIWR